MNSLERYESMANHFYRVTGIMAPGKDVPPSAPELGGDPSDRRRLWDVFVAGVEWANKDRDALLAELERDDGN